jgi:hypothetical protein
MPEGHWEVLAIASYDDGPNPSAANPEHAYWPETYGRATAAVAFNFD